MTLAPLLLTLLAAPPTLSVRVLVEERPASLWVESGEVRCDGAPVAALPVEVTLSGKALRAGAAQCQEAVTVSPLATLRLQPGGPTYRYPGEVRVGRETSGLAVVAALDLEAYVAQAVDAAWPSGGPPAALEAQAVVARTFALAGLKRHAARGYHLCDAAHCQRLVPGEASAAALRAAQRTAGQVLLAGGVALKAARSHPACGGRTSASEDVFGEGGPGPAVADVEGKAGPRCQAAPDFAWERRMALEPLGAGPDELPVEVLKRDAAGAALEVRVGGRRMTGLELLAWLEGLPDGVALPSARFTVTAAEGEVRFTGKGAGHGVGLCQAGAAAMADRGQAAAAILRAYFPGARLAPAP